MERGIVPSEWGGTHEFVDVSAKAGTNLDKLLETIVLVADLMALRDLDLRFRLIIGALISSVGSAAAVAWMLALPEHANFLQGMLVVDPRRGAKMFQRGFIMALPAKSATQVVAGVWLLGIDLESGVPERP